MFNTVFDGDNGRKRHDRIPEGSDVPSVPARPGRYAYGAYPERSWTDSETTARPSSFVEALGRHKLAIAAVAIAGGLLGYAVTIPQTRIYRAHVSLEFTGVNDNVLNTRDVDPSATGDNSSQAFINTQARVLESEPLLKRVVEKVKMGNVGEATPADEARRKKVLATLTAPMLAHYLQVRPVDGTKLVDIYVESPDPDVSTELANTLADEYMSQSVENRYDSTQRTSGWLSKQLAEVKQKLETSEAALQAYARHSNLVFTGGQDSVSEARLREIQDEYSRAQADRVAKQSVYEGLLAENPDDETASLRDPALTDYQMKLSDLNRQMADLSAVYSPGYQKIKRLKSQIDELKQDYNNQHQAALARLKNDFETAKRREDMLAAAFDSQQGVVTQDAAKEVDYNILKREAETNRSIYEAMLQRVKSYGIASALQPSNVRVVDPADKPVFPYRPNVPMTTMFGALGSFMLALIWIGIRDKGAVNIDFPGQTKQVLQTPELGVIPAARIDPYLGRASRHHLAQANTRLPNPGRLTLGEHELMPLKRTVETATWHCKSSLVAESVRSIRTSVLSGRNTTPPQIIVITSLMPSHGKTSVVSNLAIAMGELGKRVLMIDADLRSPTLHKTFSLSNESGLTTILTESGSIEHDADGLIQPTPVPNVSLLSSGPYGQTSASALFHSGRMLELLAWLRGEFATILIDTPPLTLSDARILGPLADGVILVLRAGEVKMDSVLAAEDRLAEDGSNVIGTVLNNWDPKSNGYGSYPDRYHQGSSYIQSTQA